MTAGIKNKKTRFYFLFGFLFLIVALCWSLPVQAQESLPEPEIMQGKILDVSIREQESEEGDLSEGPKQIQVLRVEITKGSKKGEIVVVENEIILDQESVEYRKGHPVKVNYSKDLEGHDQYFISDFVRVSGLVWLFILFFVLAVVIGRKSGFLSILSMIISFLIIIKLVLPQILAGRDPVLVVILASVLLIPVMFYLAHGFKKQTTLAVLSTLAALVITGLLSNIFVKATYLTGLASEEAMFLQGVTQSQFDLQGILLAGIIISMFGVLDDITVAQTSLVFKLYEVNKKLDFKKLYIKSMQVGKDHIASMVNTLVLVYTGTSLPLLLLFTTSSLSISSIVNYEIVASEIVRTLVGSIGLILAVPISTVLACLFVSQSGISKAGKA